MTAVVCFLGIQFFRSILGTVDINLAQFQYLADHLTSSECRKLVASLHFDSFELPGALDKAERSVSKDVRCLESLLHWNSEAGGGRSETHELVARRLRQLDREDLGEWLTKTSYEAIGHDFDRESKEAFKPYQPIVLPELRLNVSSTAAGIRRNATGSGGTTLAIDRFAHRRIAKQDFVPTIATDIATDPTEWTIFDTISWTLVVMMFLFVIGVMVYLTITSPCCKHHGWNNLFSKNKRYKRYECLQCEEDDYYDRSTRRSTDTRSTPVCPRTGGTCPMHSRPKRSQRQQQQSYGRRQSSQNDPSNAYANQLSPYQQQICAPCQKKSTQTDNKPFNQLSSYQPIPPCPPCQHHAKRQSTASSDNRAAITPLPVEMSESSDTEYEEASCPNICPAMQLMGCDMPKHIPCPPPCIKPMQNENNNNNSALNNNNVDKSCPIIRSPKSAAYSAAMRTIDIHQKIAIPMGPVPS